MQTASGRKFALGCDIGATKVSLALAFSRGVIEERVVDSTRRMRKPESLVSEVSAMISSMLGRKGLSRSDCVGIGVAFAGPVSFTEGKVIYGTNIPGWDDIPLAGMLSDALSIPASIMNDANVGALGEYRHGGHGQGDLLYVTISTGIGAGLVIGGRVYEGSSKVAGEIGHTTVAENGPSCGCGKRGCLETLSSGLSIARIASERMRRETSSLIDRAGANGETVNSAMVFEEARKGDMLSSEIVESACRYLGFALAGATMLMSFSTIVLGGGMAREGEYLRKRVEFYTRKELARGPNEKVRILVSRMPERVVDIGAIELAFDAASERESHGAV